MTHRSRTNLMILFIGFILIVLVSCGSKRRKPIPLSPEQSEMIKYYQTMKQKGIAGITSQFIDMRDEKTMDFVDELFIKRLRRVSPDIVQKWAYSWPDVAGLPLIQDTSDGEWRRFVFVQEGPPDPHGRERLIYPMVIWRWNDTIWKVSNASRLMSTKEDADGNEIVFSDLQVNDMFRIPPHFPDLANMKPVADTIVVDSNAVSTKRLERQKSQSEKKLQKK